MMAYATGALFIIKGNRGLISSHQLPVLAGAISVAMQLQETEVVNLCLIHFISLCVESLCLKGYILFLCQREIQQIDQIVSV